MNYMDYSFVDNCQNMFTRGQSLRMRRTLLATVNERDIWWRQGNRREMIMNNSACAPAPFQVFLTSDDDFAPINRMITCEATARNGVGSYTFEWQYRELEVGSTQWSTIWNIVPNNSSSIFTVLMQNVQSIQVRVTAIDANGQRITTSIIIRNQTNTRLPNRRVAQTAARVIAPITTATMTLGVQASPNPASDRVTVSYTLSEAATVSVEVMNILNQVLFTPLSAVQQSAGRQSIEVNLASLQTGTYFIRCTSISPQGTMGRETIPVQIIR